MKLCLLLFYKVFSRSKTHWRRFFSFNQDVTNNANYISYTAWIVAIQSIEKLLKGNWKVTKWHICHSVTFSDHSVIIQLFILWYTEIFTYSKHDLWVMLVNVYLSIWFKLKSIVLGLTNVINLCFSIVTKK